MAVQHLTDCSLTVVEGPWGFAREHCGAIAQNWEAAHARNPKLFNGSVYVTEAWTVEHGRLIGRSIKTTFAAYLYWRDVRASDDQYEEAFATTVVISQDGGILLARSVAGTLNEGLYGSPGGLLDERDVRADGQFDIADAAARELAEETGLHGAQLRREAGFLFAHVSPYLALASVYRCALTCDELLAVLGCHLAASPEPELEAPIMVHARSELDELALVPAARLLCEHVLD